MVIKFIHHFKVLSKIILILILIAWQLLSLSLFNLFGFNGLNKKNTNAQIQRCNNSFPSDVLFVKRNVNEAQKILPYLEKQKYKHETKHRINPGELCFLGYYSENNEFYSQEVEDGNLIPRSPPHNLVYL